MEKKKELTHTDYLAELGKVKDAMKGAPAILDFVQRMAPNEGYIERMPFTLKSEIVPPGFVTQMTVQGYVDFKPLHMILSDETAASFDMSDWQIGNLAQTADGQELPLETFAIKYLAKAEDPVRILDLQQWTHPTVSPATRIHMRVRNISKEERTFRGILWCAVKLYFQ